MFIIEVPYINLDQIYNSGQVPRWIKLKESHYIIPHKDKALKIEQQRNRFDWTKYRLVMNCSEEDFYNIWFNYFDLRVDYFYLNTKIKRIGKKFRRIAKRSDGIRVLNQDPFEVYIFSKLIENVGWEKAKELMNRIAMTYGIQHTQSMREAGRITWYEWPTPEIMLEKLNQEKRSSGKVKPFLRKLCNAIINEGFNILKSDNKLFRLLGMHENVFPTVEVEDTIMKNFKCTPEEFVNWYLDDVEALTYMYILYHIKNPPKEAE